MRKPKGDKFGGSKKPQKAAELADQDMYDEIDMYNKKGKGKGSDLHGLSVSFSQNPPFRFPFIMYLEDLRQYLETLSHFFIFCCHPFYIRAIK